MSEKTAKAQRREAKVQTAQMIQQMQVTAFSDGRMEVQGIPRNYKIAMSMLAGITDVITSFFIQSAKEGRLDNGKVEAPLIYKPGNGRPLVM